MMIWTDRQYEQAKEAVWSITPKKYPHEIFTKVHLKFLTNTMLYVLSKLTPDDEQKHDEGFKKEIGEDP